MPVFQLVKRHYYQTVDYRTPCLANCSTRYDKTVLSYTFTSAKKVKSHIKAHFFNSNNPIPIIGILITFKLASNTSHIREKPAMWVLRYFVTKALSTSLNCLIPAATHTAAVVASVKTLDTRTQKKTFSLLFGGTW